jgi:CheY-like chemotaxis protein
MLKQNREKSRILLAEDNGFFRYFLQEGLARYGSVDAVTSLEEAMAAVATRDYDLLVLDQDLGDGDGLSLACHLYSFPNRPYIVMCSNLFLMGTKNEHFDMLVDSCVIDGYTDKRDCEKTVEGFRVRLRERRGHYSDKPVLIVESVYNTDLITPIFERSGLEFDVVESGFEALYTYQEKEYGTVVIALPSFGARETRTVLSLAEVDNFDLIKGIRKFEIENGRERASLYSLHDSHEGYNVKFDVRVCNRENLVSLLRERFPRVRTGLIIDPNERWGRIVASHLEGSLVDGVRLGGTVYVRKPLQALKILDEMKPGRIIACPDHLDDSYSGKRLADIALADPMTKARGLSFDGLKLRNPNASPQEIVDALSLPRL